MRPKRIAGCHAESKADLMSKKAVQVAFFAERFCSTKETSEEHAVSVERPGMKPCWLELNQQRSSARKTSRFKIKRLKIFEIELRMLIGL